MNLDEKINQACLRTEQNLMLVPNVDFKIVMVGLLWEIGEERKEVVLWEFITNREHIFNNRTTIKRIKWIASRFHFLNPKFYEVTFRSFKIESQKSKLEILKVEQTTCKRMIAKISSSLEDYQSKECLKLLPYLDNPVFLKMKTKLEQYKKRLELINIEFKKLQP